ncbi:MAG: hypothetical protein OXU20_17405 [Myxococcales bacterium]|nr:hypothetical protein [Myxococcales bacterium]
MIAADQERIRERVFQLPPRQSLLYHDDATIVLAHLLNPRAPWSERSQELTGAIQQPFKHQTAVFQAIGAGVRGLLDPLSPRALARRAEEPAADEHPSDTGGLFGRLRRFAVTGGRVLSYLRSGPRDARE